MATEETTPRHYRRLKKPYDVSTVAVAPSASSAKRMRMSKEHRSYEGDMTSSLPDDILALILEKLDPRTAIATTVLSKRWLHLPRSHSCYDLAVDDILPPRYHKVKRLWMEAKARYAAEKAAHAAVMDVRKLTDFGFMKDHMNQWTWRIRRLEDILHRYERRDMRCYVKRVNAFLLSPNVVQQTIHKLRLSTFGGWRDKTIEQWVTAAIASWGVEDLELDIRNGLIMCDLKIFDRCQNVRLKRLVVSRCDLTGSSDSLLFQRLTKLSLCYSQCYEGIEHILRNCEHLVDLSIRGYPDSMAAVQFDGPKSRLKNLLVDNCKFGMIYLTFLPCLETFACRGQPTKLYYGQVPRLRHVSLDYLRTYGKNDDDDDIKFLPSFFEMMPPIESLVLQFKGPEVWIEPMALPSPLGHLRKLFIANVPMNWDISWIVHLLDASPALESCHVHIDNSSEKMASCLDVQGKQCQMYGCLKELVVVGFHAVGWQIGFVRQVMKASPRLRRLHLLDGHVVEDDERVLGGLQVVPHRREWHECEKSEVLDDLWNGICLPQLEIILE